MDRLMRGPLPEHRARGFSLIEILIAVVVLALGLLGVGAVFPVVIRSQRQSQDVVYGQIASRNAAAYLMGRQHMLDALRLVAYDTNFDGNPDEDPRYDATPWFIWSDKPADWGSVDPGSGDLLLKHPKPPNSTITSIYVPASERLFPAPFTVGVNPQYIWDVAVRRKRVGGFQVLVVTRRLDQQIAVPEDLVLSNVLTGKYLTSGGQRRLPMSVDAAGRPTGNGGPPGIGTYSRLRSLELDQMHPSDNALISVRGMDDGDPTDQSTTVLPYANAVGQKLVDNLGTVYTVAGTEPGDKGITWMRVEPALTVQARRQKSEGASVQFVMTPQVPVDVRVIDVAE
ncbi:MAG: prepilin-type N-terminal cleavage/methylation domain-containing protein [Phycisphaerales bacterium]|nr:prepilin-type N-terminal cleavage/methylation domain-containing protein [Phycisphaerales bacterium]